VPQDPVHHDPADQDDSLDAADAADHRDHADVRRGVHPGRGPGREQQHGVRGLPDLPVRVRDEQREQLQQRGSTRRGAPSRARHVLRRLRMADSYARSLISSSQLNRARNKVIYRIVLTAVVVIFTLVFIGPLYFLFTDGLKSTQEAIAAPPTLYPHNVHPSNYTQAWNRLAF